MAYRIITLILLLCSTSATAGLFDAPGRSNFVPADQAFAFDFQQQQHDVNLSWQIKDGYYLYRQQFTFRAAGATIDEPALPAGEWHQDEFYGKSEIFRQRLTVPVTVKQAEKDATLTVTWQGCADAGFCYPPETKVIPLSAVLATSADGQATAIEPMPSTSSRPAFNPPLPAGGKSLKILFIGNSFTVDATEHLPGMLKSAGITHVRMVRAYHGGYKLPEFFENYAAPDICTYYYCEPGATKWENEGTLNRSLKSIVESDTWDIVTLQEHTGSYYAWEWDETERGAISGLCDYIQQAQPLDRPTIGYIMAQAYGAYHSHYPKYFANQQAMFEAIVAQVRKITAQTCIDIVIPSGTSLQNLRTSSLNRDNGMDLTRDSYHMDYGISRYAAAATVFRTLVTPCTGVSVEGNGYRYSTSSTSTTGYSTPVTDANAPVAIRAALEACRTPYAVTDMSKY